jgi:hypothetical protein
MRPGSHRQRPWAAEALEDRSLLSAVPLETAAAASESSEPSPIVVIAPGDANLDGLVNFADYQIWADHYLKEGDWSFPEGDFNNDSVVDGGDYTLWADNYAAAPEPIDSPAAAALPETVSAPEQIGSTSLLSEQTAVTESDTTAVIAPLKIGGLATTDESNDDSLLAKDAPAEESDNRSTDDSGIATDDRTARSALLHYLAETFDSAEDSDLDCGINRRSDLGRR